MPRPSADASLEDDYATCAALIRQGSRSFHTASLLLPRRVRIPAFALYAFCRVSDDAVDGPGAAADAAATLMRRLDRAYAGEPDDHPADRAFADVVTRFSIPKALPAALIDGLAWDEEGRRFGSFGELRAYSARVAAAVGAMMTVLMGVRDPDVLARACDLGVAMQLTNIARDIGEDARNGRLYLPLDWLTGEGLEEAAFLAAPRFDGRIARLTRRLLEEAEALYARAAGGVAGLPFACRPAVHAARIIYREIGREVARRGYNSIDTRAVVPDRRKLALVALAAAQSGVIGRRPRAAALAETQFLVTAVPPVPPHQGRIGFVLDMIDTLREREAYAFARFNAGESRVAD